ncbi:hypothetical protein PRZ48_013690 [Zasmidium cellare]|uniref:RhoGAP-domain-containing protein n=1 Tax=Zasmidium cellare TaxID=395010 RepID=A0ABR0E206_ZASCE|nr:hypothetical protein PRZ48_013690 [Zasmidium cellare]
MSGEFSRDETNGDVAVSSPALNHSANGDTPVSPQAPKPGSSGGLPSKPVDDVMYSNIGVSTLLDRLKQSIASARDFAQFLKKRSSLEEDQAKGLKRLASSQLENVKRSEVRSGTYAAQMAELLRVHERMADNGMQFALSLHQMHEDLDVLSGNMERGRKQWKHEGLAAEKTASDAEQAMQKAKSRYDSLAEDYDRAKTGDTKGSRRIGLKGPKSAEQYETDLFRKVEAADQDYKEKVRQAQNQREQLLKTDRPKAVKALQELIKECDSALTLQLQKFSTFNEKLLLGNGLAVSPLTDGSGPRTQRSLRDLVLDIDNDKDFHSYVSSHSGKVTRPSEIRYEQHPTLAPKTQMPKSAAPPSQPSAPAMQPTLAVNTGTSQPGSMTSRYDSQPQPFTQPPPSSSYGYQDSPRQETTQSPAYQSTQSPYNPQATLIKDTYNTPPYPVEPSERVGTGFSQHQQTTGSIVAAAPPQIDSFNHQPAPTGKGRVFGVSLDDLFARDQSAVPIIVFQCIQAIDMFGLETEGIYRQSGTHSFINRLREAFDTLPANSPQLDFRNPSNFHHDVNAVASLLKAFFKELPDPLFTKVGYAHFIEAAQVDDEVQRRDAIHQGINDLPDPNYATMRALVLHLNRVMQNEAKTRMNSENLAVCFAPTLMGNQNGAIADASWQHRVVATILANATAIFDED